MTTNLGSIESLIKKAIIKLSSSDLVHTPEWVLLDASHLTAKQFRERFEEAWREYFKFCVIRNTYDRVISQWRWMLYNPGNIVNEKSMSLSNFLDHSKANKRKGFSSWNTYTINDRPVIDDYVRFENLKKDVDRVLRNKIGISFDGWLPNKKSSSRKRHDYSVSSDEICEIYKIHKKEIDYWGFEVPGEL